jgi:hypothetical protein
VAKLKIEGIVELETPNIELLSLPGNSACFMLGDYEVSGGPVKGTRTLAPSKRQNIASATGNSLFAFRNEADQASYNIKRQRDTGCEHDNQEGAGVRELVRNIGQ